MIYKLERHKWPDEIAAEKRERRKKLAVICSCLLIFCRRIFLFPVRWEKVPREQRTPWRWKKLETVYSLLNEKWYFGKDIEDLSVTLMEKAIAGMASSDLDIHTTYMSLEDAQTFSSSLEGTFIGVGLQFYQNSRGEYIVADVFENSPAQKAGIERKDRLVQVEGSLCDELSQDEIKDMLTKSEGKEVSLVIEREGRELEVQVTPAVVDSSVIAYEENGYGYLQLSSFFREQRS